MLHPVLRDRIKNKGLLITLNSIAGYDSEYDLKSSLFKTNELLSIQLAANSYLSVKVPDVDYKTLTVSDFKIKDVYMWGEGKYISQCCKSMVIMMKEIRELLFKENDLLLGNMLTKLDSLLANKEIRSKTILKSENSVVYTFHKSKVSTLIKYLNNYKIFNK